MNFFLFVLGILTVKLVKVTNLRDVDGIGNKSDPYVKLRLKQDNWFLNKRYGSHKSSMKRNELSPEYDETFEFKDLPSLKNMVLNVKIMDDDYGLDDEMGGAKLKLNSLQWHGLFSLGEEPRRKRLVVDQKANLRGLRRLFRKKAMVHLELSYKE